MTSAPPPPPDGTNGLAVTSAALGIIPALGGVPALILGIIALRRVRETGQKGKAHAIAGIVLGVFWIVAIAAIIVNGGISPMPNGMPPAGLSTAALSPSANCG